MPSLTQTLNTGYRAVLHVYPKVWQTKHSRSSGHSVLPLDNLP